MFDNYYGSTGLLDGLVIFVRTYGFPAGQLSSGWRVLGYRPMRFLCLLMGLEAPRGRLRGEQRIATPEDLLEDWQCGDRAQVQPNRGLGITHRVQLLRIGARSVRGGVPSYADGQRLEGRSSSC